MYICIHTSYSKRVCAHGAACGITDSTSDAHDSINICYSMFMPIYIYVYVYAYAYIYIHINVYIYTYMCVYIYMYSSGKAAHRVLSAVCETLDPTRMTIPEALDVLAAQDGQPDSPKKDTFKKNLGAYNASRKYFGEIVPGRTRSIYNILRRTAPHYTMGSLTLAKETF